MKNDNKNILLWVLGIVLALFLLGGFGRVGFGMGYGYGGMMGMMYGSYGSGMMLFGWLYGILVLVALVLLIIWLWNQIQNPRKRR
jgi:uncharacterized membrane protein